jgi:hypothetical protein
MTPLELFNELKEYNFTFTKPCFESEKLLSDKLKDSMNKLIACELAEEISKNKYSLTTEGRKASILGIEKWTRSLTDINRRNLVYNCFGLYNNWYSVPRLEMTIERSIKSTISKQLWNVIIAVIIALVLYSVKKIFNIEL